MSPNVIKLTLIESDRSRTPFFGSTALFVFTLLTVAFILSMYAKETVIAEDLSDARLVMPVTHDEVPPQPEPQRQLPDRQPPSQSAPTAPPMAPTSVTPPTVISPDVPISVTPPEKPSGFFPIPVPEYSGNPGPTRSGTGDNPTGLSTGGTGNEPTAPKAEEPPPPPPPKPEPKPVESPKKPKTVSLGVISGKATSLPKPIYPPTAKLVRAGGPVTVEVHLDEDGNVTSAKAISGNPLLYRTAEDAARKAKFSPTYLSGEKVKVTGIITYNFIP